MTETYIDYQLVDGYIHNWLLAGPLAISIPNPGEIKKNERKLEIAKQFYNPEIEFQDKPVEIASFKVGDTELRWRYVHCADDHFMTTSTSNPAWSYVRHWAYTQIQTPAGQILNLVLTTLGPADVWINGVHIHRHEVFSDQEPQTSSFQATFEPGDNLLMIRLGQVVTGVAPCVLTLRLTDLPVNAEKDFKVLIPTIARYPNRYKMFERAFEYAYLEEVVNYRGAHFNLHWADDLGTNCHYSFQVQDKDGYVYVDGHWDTNPKEPLDIGHGFRLFERPYWVVLHADKRDYEELGLRYERKLPLYVIDNTYSTKIYDSMPDRRQEALEDAAKYNRNIFAEIAKIELNRWEGVDHTGMRWYPLDPKFVEDIIARVNRRETDSEINLVGLLGMVYRYSDIPSFPARLKQPLEDCILNFRYWLDEPGNDALEFTSESQGILFPTCAILAGQLFPRRKFANSSQTGYWHRKKGEQLALDWLHQRGVNGFQDWNSPASFELFILALTHLTSLAKDSTIKDLAAVLLDKLFLTMAINSYKGAFGAPHGRVNSIMLKSAQLEATSGSSRFLWGLGVYNSNLIGTVSLTTSNYEFPIMIGDIAADTPAEMLNKECHLVDPVKGEKVNTVTYKTPDYMLSSVQDYRPGQPGSNEHVWQATMGTEAVVFVNHPTWMSEDEAFQPGFWRGNRVLPRVAQWKNVLIAIHNLPEDDRLGFTHAYVPILAFDEFEFISGWLFLRKENGYLALTAAKGLELIQHSPDGYREVRSYGSPNIWICHMGRKAVDGKYLKFRNKIMARKPEWKGLSVDFKTLRGEQLSFGWEGSLMVNGEEQPLAGYKHLDNPYCRVDLPAKLMDVTFGDYVMRLNFE